MQRRQMLMAVASAGLGVVCAPIDHVKNWLASNTWALAATLTWMVTTTCPKPKTNDCAPGTKAVTVFATKLTSKALTIPSASST